MAIVMLGVFTAKYRGTCVLPTCERRQLIEQGDACQYLDERLHHMTCARRVMRGEAEHLCQDCYRYHAGNCQ